MLPPSGDQFEISGGGYRAVVTESGAALRVLEYAGRPLVDGFAEDEMSSGGRGQVLMPWPNRIRDGAYSFGGQDLRLALTEPARHNASHGLVRWAAWTREEHCANSVSLVYRLMAQSGYPWTLDLHVLYDLSADGLTVTQTATNMSEEAAPYASGAHPYLAVGPGPIDTLELTLPAATRSLVDDRKLPVGHEDVEGTAYDFRVTRPLRDTALDDAFAGLDRDEDGVATTVLRDPATGAGVALWVDERHHWLQVYSGDDVPATARRSLAVEPMTAPGEAFRSGEDLVTLAPSGQPGDEHSASWGLRALD
ncbi:MAG: galM [Nocardioides sp.]|nr:galM [Nocardioides sp.]